MPKRVPPKRARSSSASPANKKGKKEPAAVTSSSSSTSTTTAALPPVVWAAVVDYYHDDYKRPEGRSETIGAFTTRRAAVIACVTAALEGNAPNFERYTEKELEHEGNRAAKATQETYAEIARKVTTVDFDDEKTADAYIKQHDDVLEEFLGEPESGVMSGGYRPYVKRCELDDAAAEKRYVATWAEIERSGGRLRYDWAYWKVLKAESEGKTAVE